MSPEVEEVIQEICTTKMPDGTYPVFTSMETPERILASLSWAGLNVYGRGTNKAEVLDAVAVNFMESSILLINIISEIVAEEG